MGTATKADEFTGCRWEMIPDKSNLQGGHWKVLTKVKINYKSRGSKCIQGVLKSMHDRKVASRLFHEIYISMF